MKKLGLSIILSSIILLPTYSAAEETQAQMLEQSHQIIQKFAKHLKGELQVAMKNGGPTNAIKVCNEKAMDITSSESQSSDVTLSRTSLKIRNSANKPEAWEVVVLNQFALRKAQGEALKKMEFSETIEVDGKKQFRYMKAMGVSQACLHCHGETALPDVTKELNKLYPNDKAVGYKLGDLRGAIVLTKKL